MTSITRLCSLPVLDLIDDILDHFDPYDDRETLREVSLVSHPFLQAARRRQLSTIVLIPRTRLDSEHGSSPPLQGLLQLLTTRPHLVKHIRILHLAWQMDVVEEEESPFFPILRILVENDLRIWYASFNMRCFQTRGHVFVERKLLISLLATPTLEVVRLVNSCSLFPFRELSRAPNLQRLEILSPASGSCGVYPSSGGAEENRFPKLNSLEVGGYLSTWFSECIVSGECSVKGVRFKELTACFFDQEARPVWGELAESRETVESLMFTYLASNPLDEIRHIKDFPNLRYLRLCINSYFISVFLSALDTLNFLPPRLQELSIIIHAPLWNSEPPDLVNMKENLMIEGWLEIVPPLLRPPAKFDFLVFSKPENPADLERLNQNIRSEFSAADDILGRCGARFGNPLDFLHDQSIVSAQIVSYYQPSLYSRLNPPPPS